MRDATAECDGMGFIECFCAGDFCACELDGMPCEGCEACRPSEGEEEVTGRIMDESECDYTTDDAPRGFGCHFPDRCLLSGPHLPSECYTREMREEWEREMSGEAAYYVRNPSAEYGRTADDPHACPDCGAHMAKIGIDSYRCTRCRETFTASEDPAGD